MGGGALLLFIWAVRNHQFQSFENVKYQVFWSDQEMPVEIPRELPGEKKETLQQELKDGSNGNGNQVG